MQIQAKQVVRKVFIGVAVLAVVATAAAARAQTPDPVVGTWKLDVAKSAYKPGPTPKAVTVVVAPAGKGIKVAVDSISSDGAPMKWGFTTLRDGKEEAPVTGNPMIDTVTSTRETPTTGTNVYKKDGKVILTTKLSVSPDGKTMTLTSTGTDSKGQAVHNVGVYTKQ